MSDKKTKNAKLTGNDVADMLAKSVNVEMHVTKKVGSDEVTVSNGTGMVIMDCYVLLKALEMVGHNMLPMMKSEKDMRECLKSMIDTMNFAEPGKEREAAE